MESCWVGEQEKIPGRGKSKVGSRSLWGEGEGLVKCRVEVREGKEGS